MIAAALLLAALSAAPVAPGTGAARLWAVARDGRGGQSVVGPFEVGLPR
ncbi:MAG: hypothetical protein ACJ79L_16390 [Anaeromyxobacteraceae bacterium]